ncbi:unnamed protein product [Mycena citricolor]|uniref:DUF6534 domain-containing protein n=1 Tax=Mycena citricolor TaxID=2018698 RepID=A0AAD2K0Z7_9AGAR|nr:unnamed protein product [Mycena citricolor]
MGEFDTTLGALCVAYMLAWGLFGVMSMQTYRYYHIFIKDALWIKTLVGGLWILDTLQLVLIGSCLYFWVITNYANPAVLANSTWTFNIGILVTNSIVIIVQFFLARRVWILSNRNYLLTGLIVTLSCCYYGFEMDRAAVQLVKIELFFKFQTIASVGLACAAAADLTIATSLSWYLLRSRTGIKTTDSVVNKLILYAMNTGTLTAIVVLIDMICFLTMPNNLIHIAFNLVSGKLYTNSLLATLNYRDTVRSHAPRAMNMNTTISLSHMSAATGPTGGSSIGTAPVFAPNSKFHSSASTGDHTLGVTASQMEDYTISNASELKVCGRYFYDQPTQLNHEPVH